jgi:hypothetical protein
MASVDQQYGITHHILQRRLFTYYTHNAHTEQVQVKTYAVPQYHKVYHCIVAVFN